MEVFKKRVLYVVKPSNFYIIYYKEICKSWFILEIILDVLIHASILFCYSQKHITSRVC